MCGILAISTNKRHSNFDIDASLRAISHRGPDDIGNFSSESGDCYLGHVRLSIIDLSQAGHQPMIDGTGRYVLSYNGEVYNFTELKRDLEKYHGNIKWESSTDTEVILEGFAREGETFLGKLNGLFALTIYDKVDRALTVLRDPLGIKPLYFTEQDGGVFFCSELKGLKKLKEFKQTLRQESLADQLAFMYIPEPYTMYNEFFKLEPGVCKVYIDGKEVRSSNLFEHLEEPLYFSTEEDAITCFRDSFSKAVTRKII